MWSVQDDSRSPWRRSCDLPMRGVRHGWWPRTKDYAVRSRAPLTRKTMTNYYRVTTHDLRSPIQGGGPIWDGSLPYDLPMVEVDTGPMECAPGWHATREPHVALRIAGLWPNGYPSRLWRVEPTTEEVIERGDGCRAATWRIVEEVEVGAKTLGALHAPMAGDGLPLDDLVAEVMAWRDALARPEHDEHRVESALRDALDARGLEEWKLQRYDDAGDAGDAQTTSDRYGRDAWAWDPYQKSAWYAMHAWDALVDWETTGTLGKVAWDSWDTRSVCDWHAIDALMVYAASKRGWIDQDPMLLTTGIRDAYRHGLAVAVPVGQKTLGWAMEDAA